MKDWIRYHEADLAKTRLELQAAETGSAAAEDLSWSEEYAIEKMAELQADLERVEQQLSDLPIENRF